MSDDLKDLYDRTLKEIEGKPTRWDRFSGPNREKFLDIVKVLDMMHDYLMKLMKKGRRMAGALDVVDKVEEVAGLVNRVPLQIDPENWPRCFVDVTEDPNRLRAARDALVKAFDSFKKIYFDVSLKIDAKRRGRWVMTTPILFQHLRDAMYGLDQYLKAS